MKDILTAVLNSPYGFLLYCALVQLVVGYLVILVRYLIVLVIARVCKTYPKLPHWGSLNLLSWFEELSMLLVIPIIGVLTILDLLTSSFSKLFLDGRETYGRIHDYMNISDSLKETVLSIVVLIGIWFVALTPVWSKLIK